MTRIFGAAILAGLLAGLLVSIVQEVRVVPLLFEAEAYEAGAHAAAHTDHAGHAHDHGAAAWMPADGAERRLYTWMANIVTAVGFGLILTACYALRGRPVQGRDGLLWGLAGFTAFGLAPALGLPPELPGAAPADLVDRQIWWVLTAVATAGGLALLAFGRRLPWQVAGGALIATPHLIGAPVPEGPGTVPADLAAEFAVASLATASLFWVALGMLTGAFYRRFC